jgi:predicted RNA binding protein YcfA (HicA-like mRNA interferase family)
VKLPRDLSGEDLAVLLRRYGYQVTRQTGSHLRLTSTLKGREHHLTVPSHKTLKLGTLSVCQRPIKAARPICHDGGSRFATDNCTELYERMELSEMRDQVADFDARTDKLGRRL